MNLEFEPAEKEFQLEVRAFFENDYPPEIKSKIRSSQRLSKADHVIAQRSLNSRGWLGLGWPREFGGPGWSEVQRFIFESELERAGAANIIPMGVIYIGPILAHFATPEQQQRWMPNILNSSEFWAQGYSEPESGSDLASLSMSASDDGDYYRVNGSKIWTTMAHWADWIFCLVRTSKDDRKQAGISFLCIEMSSPGVTVHPITTMNGAHELNRVTFDNVLVSKKHRIGEEGKGWHYANVLLGKERLSYAHIGKKKADLRRVKAFASELPSDQGPSLLEDPLISADIASLEAQLETLEVSILRGLTGDLNPVAISALKIACTECAQRITELFMLVAGRSALAFPDLNKDDWAQALGCTPAFGPISASDYLLERAQSIYGGTNEIQKNIIWKSLSRG